MCLGAMHYHGMAGMERNPRKAFEVYNLAAERGQCGYIIFYSRRVACSSFF